jgi:hypothetical protein
MAHSKQNEICHHPNPLALSTSSNHFAVGLSNFWVIQLMLHLQDSTPRASPPYFTPLITSCLICVPFSQELSKEISNLYH